MLNSSARQGETLALASFCSDLQYSDLDEEVDETAKKAVVDYLACCYAGIETEAGEAIMRYVEEFSTGGGATVIGCDLRPSPEFAALANGTTAHALDADDGHRGASAHPGSAVIPAAMAVAESNNSSGEELVTAIAAGYEAMVATAVAVQTSHRQRHFHATATCGCFGAAAAVSRIMELDQERTAHALGLAGTQAGGLFEFLEKGSMAKRFHPGRAAHAGIMAAKLAAAGLDGPDTIIEGSEGFAEAYADTYDLSSFETLGEPFEVTRNYIKPYACCRHIHGPIEAAITIRGRGVDPGDVEHVRIETYQSAAEHDKKDVQNVLDAQMSMPYGIAVALAEGDTPLDSFRNFQVDGVVENLISQVEVVQTDKMESLYPDTRPATVRVSTVDGSTYEELVKYPRGCPENPLSKEELSEKFAEFTANALPPDRREQLFENAFTLNKIDDVADFTELV